MADLKDLGTVLEYVGKKGKLRFNDRNLAGEKRIIVKLVPKKGEILKVCCSESVTNALREQTLKLGELVTLQLMENEDGVKYICHPQGNDVDVEVDGLDIREVKADKEFEMEDYLAL